MEEHAQPNRQKVKKAAIKKLDKTEVYVMRDFKEYLGESALIIFSVLLALFLTEFINSLHEKEHTKELLTNIKEELIKNKHNEELQYAYQASVLKNIDSALNTPAFQQQIITNGQMHLKYIAPQGINYRDLSDVAWQVAQSQNITLKMHFKLVARLTDIYEQQSRIAKLEDECAKVLLSYDSRNPANIRTTLILLRDNYHGWAFDRAKNLLTLYDEAIKEIDE